MAEKRENTGLIIRNDVCAPRIHIAGPIAFIISGIVGHMNGFTTEAMAWMGTVKR